jgi:heterodisulfide reductase subunit A-like polyferredoxin
LTPSSREVAGLELQRGSLKADPVTLETSVTGVFAGGDAVSGPSSVIQAIATGKRAAESIARYLLGQDMRGNRFEDTIRPLPKDLLPSVSDAEKKRRAQPPCLPVESYRCNFSEVEAGLTEEGALAESDRCLNCGLCSECQECVRACEHLAVNHSMTERTVKLEVGAVILAPGFEEFDAGRRGEFGYKRYPNVITSVQFERMLSASGPFEGRIMRRSDGTAARRSVLPGYSASAPATAPATTTTAPQCAAWSPPSRP